MLLKKLFRMSKRRIEDNDEDDDLLVAYDALEERKKQEGGGGGNEEEEEDGPVLVGGTAKYGYVQPSTLVPVRNSHIFSQKILVYIKRKRTNCKT